MVSLMIPYHFLLVTTLVAVAQGQTDDSGLPCEDLGLSCVSRDSDSCLQTAPNPGCPENEICCVVYGTSGQRPEAEGMTAAAELGLVSGYPCKKNKKRCRNQGGFCFDPFAVDPYCDIQNPDLCGRGRCSCCINCANQAAPEACEKYYGGKCQFTCNRDRIPTGYCKGECRCCGCKIGPSCSSRRGYCITAGTPCKGITVDEGCEGMQCQCCIPEWTQCQNTKSCSFSGGYCSSACQVGETPHYGLCSSKTCTCCVQDLCLQSGGYCTRVACSPDRGLARGMCSKDDFCCLPPGDIRDEGSDVNN